MLQVLQGLDRSSFLPNLYLLYAKGVLLSEVPNDVSIHAFWKDRSLPRLNWPGRVQRQQISDLARVLRTDKIDVTYDRLFHMTLINGPASRRENVGRVSTIVSPPEQDLPRTERRWVWIKRMQLARAYRTADRLLAVSQDTADRAAVYYRIPISKIEVLPSPIDLKRIDSMARANWLGLPIEPSRQNLLAVGRLSEEKGHRYLVDAFATVLKTTYLRLDLHLVGDGPLRPTLEDQASRLGIRSHVFFHGYSENPFCLMSKCDLFCLPSDYEGLPNVLLEAMACRIPIIATDCTRSLDDILSPPERGEVVQRANSKALADCHRRSISQPRALAVTHRSEPKLCGIPP